MGVPAFTLAAGATRAFHLRLMSFHLRLMSYAGQDAGQVVRRLLGRGANHQPRTFAWLGNVISNAELCNCFFVAVYSNMGVWGQDVLFINEEE